MPCQSADMSTTINWYAAPDGFEKSEFVAEYFGAEFQKIFSALKRDECNQFFAQVSELDHRWHLRLA